MPQQHKRIKYIHMKEMKVGKKKKIYGKPPVSVYQINFKTNEIIHKYSSATVAENITGINKNSILACIRGDQNNAGGFKWMKQAKI